MEFSDNIVEILDVREWTEGGTEYEEWDVIAHTEQK